MLSIAFVLSVIVFFLGYRYYGSFLVRSFGLSPDRKTPAVEINDGMDFCPARAPVLFGHHFSSIAGAGPIVGPVLAGIAFGWLPALVWIVLGSIFIGGVHDMGSLAASIRHKARSVAEVARDNITPRAGKLFLVFIWLALVLVLAAFIDLTASTFVTNGGVASSASFYIVLALLFGLALYKLKMPLRFGTLLFVPLVFIIIWVGRLMPVALGRETFVLVLAVYCFAASITPVWLLLQPRDYLSSFLLYACLLCGGAGIILSGASLEYPAFLSFHNESLGLLFPALFITIACGACSGFHSIVASGTTARQLSRETDARPIGYGAMLVEGVLALIALAAVMSCAAGSDALKSHPTQVFAAGLGSFLSKIGIPEGAGADFGLLAISTFLLTTLDTATRLARYVFEEFLGRRGWGVKIAATALTLGLPLFIISVEVESGASGEIGGRIVPAYKMIWPVFGATNQLLGGLALLTIAVWLKRTGRRALFALIPMVFMIGVTLWGLVQIVCRSLAGGLSETAHLVKFTASALLILLALVLIVEAARSLMFPSPRSS